MAPKYFIPILFTLINLASFNVVTSTRRANIQYYCAAAAGRMEDGSSVFPFLLFSSLSFWMREGTTACAPREERVYGELPFGDSGEERTQICVRRRRLDAFFIREKRKGDRRI